MPNLIGLSIPVMGGAEIYDIENVHRLSKIRAPRCAILALPLKLAGRDGMDFPAEFTVTA